jgi:hypothetical protein
MLFSLGTSGLALMADVPDYSEGRPDDRHRTQHEDAVQNSHRGEDNKSGVRRSRGPRATGNLWEKACSV